MQPDNVDNQIACEICYEFGIGPVMTRPRPKIDANTIHNESPEQGSNIRELDDGWVLHWASAARNDYIAICPYHARGVQVPRPAATMTIADLTIDLQEFDYMGERMNTVLFRNIESRRYLNIRYSAQGLSAGELVNERWISFPISEGLTRARERVPLKVPLRVGLRVFTSDGPGMILRPKFAPNYWVIRYDDGHEEIEYGENLIVASAQTAHQDNQDGKI